VQGFFFCLLSVGERSPEEGQIRRERICTLRSNGPVALRLPGLQSLLFL